MGRSSSLLIFLISVGGLVMPALGAPSRLMGLHAPHVMIGPRPHVVGRTNLMRLHPIAGRVVRRQRFGLDVAGLGLSTAADLATPRPIAADLPDADTVVPAWPPCNRPQIIRVGLGLRHPAHTRIFYGPPVGCLP